MQARDAIYLDANAGSPLSEAAQAAVFSLLGRNGPGLSVRERGELLGHDRTELEVMRAESPGGSSGASARVSFGALLPNASSSHIEGRRAKALIRQARAQVAASLGAKTRPEDLVFVSSGTEATQMAIRAELEAALLRGERPHWILTQADHEAHFQLVPWLKARGGEVSFLPLDADCRVCVEKLPELIRPQTRLVSAVWVNNETGIISDILKLAAICTSHGISLHLDGAQAWGKLPLELADCGASSVSFSGHKIGALSGTGVLWRAAPAGRGSESLIPGKQESGARGGTENLLGIVSLGAAAAALDVEGWSLRLGHLRERLEARVRESIPGTRVYGARAPRVSNTSFFGFEGVERSGLVAALDLAGYCVSSGSACSSGVAEPSRSLLASGLSEAQASAAVRVSLSAGIQWPELEGFVAALAQTVARARPRSSAEVWG